jgi:hypothetical protein
MKTAINRRSFLKGAGVCMSLPFLDAMQPAFGAAKVVQPRRMVAIQTNQGILPQFFFPEKAGKDYQLTSYLKILEKHRDNFTVFSGVSHPDVDGGHAAERTFLSAAPHPGSPTFRPSISIDQLAAEELGSVTRFPSLVLSVQSGNVPNQSVTRGGITLPTMQSPSKLYQQLFVDVKPEEIEGRIRELRNGRSLLDFVGESSKQLQQNVGTRDRERLDQYFTSVRDLEQRMVRMEEWKRKPKPKVKVPAPQDIADSQRFVEKGRLILDMVKLALETDSSRIVSFFLDATAIHPITHHGNRPEVLAELRKVEESEFQILNSFLTALSEVKEEGETLLDRTMVLYGTCMGSANSHSNYNLPVMLAGGGFKHGQHIAFDPKPGKNYPLPNLYVSMLQRLGLPVDKFATSTGTMRGLEIVG